MYIDCLSFFLKIWIDYTPNSTDYRCSDNASVHRANNTRVGTGSLNLPPIWLRSRVFCRCLIVRLRCFLQNESNHADTYIYYYKNVLKLHRSVESTLFRLKAHKNYRLKWNISKAFCSDRTAGVSHCVIAVRGTCCNVTYLLNNSFVTDKQASQ